MLNFHKQILRELSAGYSRVIDNSSGSGDGFELELSHSMRRSNSTTNSTTTTTAAAATTTTTTSTTVKSTELVPFKPSSTAPASASVDACDGLVILAHGLGIEQVLLGFLLLHAQHTQLVLLINTPAKELVWLKDRFVQQAAARPGICRPDLFKTIDAATPAQERSRIYLDGGVIGITSRILVVDMLNKMLPVDKLSGILVNNAHKVNDTSNECFILRLFRNHNKIGFIRAFSSYPEAFTTGIWKLEKSMKLLFLRHVYIWPRFHVQVSNELEFVEESVNSRSLNGTSHAEENQQQEKGITLIELRVPLSRLMKEIQAGLVDCLEACIQELKRCNPYMDIDEFTVENAFFKSFDIIVRSQLDPIWHRVSFKTKQLVNDLKTLRNLLRFLTSYDCVSFYSFLETILAASASAGSSERAGFRSGGDFGQSPWLLLDAAQVVFESAKSRVYKKGSYTVATTASSNATTTGGGGIAPAPPRQLRAGTFPGVPPNFIPILEEQPKWSVLVNILREIQADRLQQLKDFKDVGPILIMVEGDRSCKQLREILSRFDLTVIKDEKVEMGDGDEDDFDRSGDGGSVPNLLSPQSSTSSSSSSRLGGGGGGAAAIGIQSRRRARGGGKTGSSGSGTSSRAPSTTTTQTRFKRFSTLGVEGLMKRIMKNYFQWRGGLNTATKNLYKKSAAANQQQRRSSSSSSTSLNSINTSIIASASRASSSSTASASNTTTNNRPGFNSFVGRGSNPPAKRRRMRGGGGSGGGVSSRPPSVTTYSSSTTAVATDEQTSLDEPLLPSFTNPNEFEDDAAALARFLDAEAVTDVTEGGAGSTTASTTATAAETDENVDGFDVTLFNTHFGLIRPENMLVIRPYCTSTNGEQDGQALQDLKPSWVIMYDPDVGFVRRLESFKALHRKRELKVYFMVYDNSVEEQRYLSAIRKEKASFEKMIRQKSIMAIPVDQDGRVNPDVDDLFWDNADTRVAAGRSIRPVKVIVDIREFGSSLPNILQAKRLALLPITLEVGDYVLSPEICVERKSIADLIGSFKSGRLYNQCQAMSAHYKYPILLIEFEKSRSFTLQSSSSIFERSSSKMNKGGGGGGGAGAGTAPNMDLQSKLTLLTLHFPKLGIIWSQSPQATAEIFEDLKRKQAEPDADVAVKIGVENSDTLSSEFNQTPLNMLRAIPGINARNYRHVVLKVSNLRELSGYTLEQCKALVGNENGTKIFNFFRTDMLYKDVM